MMWGNGYYMMGWGWLAGVLVLVVVVVAVIFIVRMLQGRTSTFSGSATFPQPPAAGGVKTAREVLDERYAKGDLSTEEYLERIKHLGSA